MLDNLIPNTSDTKFNEEIRRFSQILRKYGWSKETSADKLWTPGNAALGQCAVTSLVVQDYFNGDIIWAEPRTPGLKAEEKGPSHYFNLINGLEVDLTRDQFPDGTIIPSGIPKLKGFPSTRDYVLSFPPTVERYNILKAKIREYI